MVSSIDLESSEEWLTYWSQIHILTFFLDFFTVMSAMKRDKDLCPVSGPERSTKGSIRRRDILGCVIHDYYRQPPPLVSDYRYNICTIHLVLFSKSR
jgi:hypothetical protein